ncbi:MAG: hypothetical protein M1822_000830 [Bathelium mastoideum]|nr:MAG: hypothetical protein M1822_000830 [Bathelium mastoideum]
MAPSNQAAFLIAKHTPLKIQPSTYTSPHENEIVIKNAAVALNPYEYIIQDAANLAIPWVKLPCILGTDVAGEVVEVGPGVTRFKVGDRVVGHAVGLDKRVNRACEGGFQHYTVLRTHMTTPVPPSIPYTSAAVIPLGLSTAACALFQSDYLALPLPTTPSPPASDRKRTVLIWGGSTSVGCNAIQVAVAAGCAVVATASPHNHALLRQLGASTVIDYRSPTAVSDVVAALRGRTVAGALAIGQGSLSACADVLGACPADSTQRFVAQATLDVPPFPWSAWDLPGFALGAVTAVLRDRWRLWRTGVRAKFINGSDLVANEVGKGIYEEFLPRALADGAFVPAPEARVVGEGLERLQEGMDTVRKGVSAQKLVVTL